MWKNKKFAIDLLSTQQIFFEFFYLTKQKGNDIIIIENGFQYHLRCQYERWSTAKRQASCFDCATQCKYVSVVKEGKYTGTESEVPEYETVEAFASNFLSTDTNSLIRANYLCNIY